MLLYSTTLSVTDKMTRRMFMNLVIQWNNESTHAENRIPDLSWNGESEICYGNDYVSLSVNEYRNRNIMAVRYRKSDSKGKIWDTDYIMNFEDMKISVQLNRSFSEDAITSDPVYSTPHFLSYLINGGFLEDDNGIPVLREPHYIDENNADFLNEIISGKSGMKLPVVYISRTRDNELPVDAVFLASKLKGIAHVVVQNDISSNGIFREKCGSNNEFSGAIGIYFPNSAFSRKRIWYKSGDEYRQKAFDAIVRNVSQFSISQTVPPLYTWMGIKNSLLQDRLESQRSERIAAEKDSMKAQEERDLFISSFDDELNKYEQKITELTKENERLQAENQGYRIKLSLAGDSPVIKSGEETDLFPGEIREMILYVLDKELKNCQEGTRKSDILTDIIESNDYCREIERRRAAVQTLLKNYKRLTGPLRSDLEDIGITITEGNHYKTTYYDDNRYYSFIAKTPSDGRGIKNEISELLNKIL